MARSNRRKALPPVDPQTDRKTRPFLEAIKEILEVGDGVRGDPMERKLTVRDLVDSGLAKWRRGAPGTDGILRPGDNLATGGEPPNMSVPPRPEGFHAVGSFGYIVLSWNLPDDQYGNHGLTNIYRSEDDNFANATLLGRDTGMMYTDQIRSVANTGVGYYYWITFVSDTGVEGPPNDPNGTYAELLPDAGFLLDTLSSSLDEAPTTMGSPDETLILHAHRFALRTGPNDDPVYPVIVSEINGVPTVVMNTTIIREGSIQEGQLGPITVGKLRKEDGTPLTTVAGTIRADAIQTDALTINFGRVSGDLQSTQTGSNGRPVWRFYRNGGFELNSSSSGGRMEQRGDNISVYDGNGRLRVKIGRL